jgi:hypothetical protein
VTRPDRQTLQTPPTDSNMPIEPIVDGSREPETYDLARFVDEAESLRQGNTRVEEDGQDDGEISMKRFCEFMLLGQHPDRLKGFVSI